MTVALVLIASGILIGAGISVIWRDMQRNRRRAFVSERDPRTSADPEEVEITISLGASTAPAPVAPRIETVARPAPMPADDRETAPQAAADDADRAAQGHRPLLERQWLALQPTLVAAVDKVNAMLGPLLLSIGATGEPTWSYKNGGYGAYRRLLLDDESVGWLRLELSADGRLHAGLKAHKDEQAEIGCTAETAGGALSVAAISDLLSRCLEPAATYAARSAAGGGSLQEASERAWRAVDALVAAALKATNGALAQAGARLVPLTPPVWEAELHRHRMTLSVEVNGSDVARMLIERLPHEMEVAVGVRDQRLVDLGRRRRIPVEGMSIHALAELIASCAWPAIARFRETRRPA